MTKLSIIIPIYNVEEYIRQCLESVLEQDCESIEVVMVNDCSTDSSGIIAKQFETKFFDSVLMTHTENKGLGPARNTAISAAKGEYVMMLDSDDWLCESAISNVLDCIATKAFDLAQFGCNKVHPNHVEDNLYMDFASQGSKLIDQQVTLLKQPNYAWLKIVSKALIDKHQLEFNNIYYEDIPWSIGLTLNAKKIVFCGKTICNYRQRQGSIIYTQSPKHLDLLKAYRLVFDQISQTNINPVLKRSLNDSFIKAAYYLYRQRHVRLGGSYIDEYKRLYFSILKSHSIYPGSLRTLAMFCITYLKAKTTASV
jgi:CDP-glycerol glycerophosphotransferase